MKVILTQDMPNLGKGGEIVSVKDGYARNYLIPRGFATVATIKKMNQLRHQQQMIQAQIAKQLKGAQEIADRMKETSVTISRLVGEEERIFGSVTSKDIEEALREEGFVIDKRNIVVAEPIKQLGVYHVQVNLHPEITSEVKVWVVAK